jgi:hypothetical protein
MVRSCSEALSRNPLPHGECEYTVMNGSPRGTGLAGDKVVHLEREYRFDLVLEALTSSQSGASVSAAPGARLDT